MDGGTLVTSCVMHKILTGNEAREAAPISSLGRVLGEDHELTGKKKRPARRSGLRLLATPGEPDASAT